MQERSIMAQANKVMMTCHIVLNSVLFVAYIGEYLKGAKTLGFTLMFSVLTLGPTVVDIMLNKKDPANGIMKHFIPISFAVLNTVAMFTSESKLTFTYVLVLMVCMMLYLDPKYALRIGVLTFIVNAIDVVYKFMTGVNTAADSADVEIRLAVLAVISAFEYVITKKINDMNNEKQAVILKEKEKTEVMLNEILELSGNMTVAIDDVNDHMNSLSESTHLISRAMDEVSQGNQETAESIQNQSMNTEDIQKMIDRVKDISGNILEGMEKSLKEVTEGHDNMEKLSELAEQSSQANDTVVSLVAALKDQTEKMTEIITMITSIANSTGMLALNASIEAARAGEAGKGFAVVATQVSGLADQTKGASANITDLIKSVVTDLDNVVDAVEVLRKSTSEEEVKINELRSNLQTITDMTNDVTGETEEMEKMILNLAKANEDIVGQIQTISAVTQEVTARSSETVDACQENSRLVDEVSRLADTLNADAQKLKASTAEL